jgi:hypothetical protein
MVCTVAAIVYFLGYMPEPGTIITVPKGHVEQLTPRQKAKAERCARKYGIQWKVAE